MMDRRQRLVLVTAAAALAVSQLSSGPVGVNGFHFTTAGFQAAGLSRVGLEGTTQSTRARPGTRLFKSATTKTQEEDDEDSSYPSSLAKQLQSKRRRRGVGPSWWDVLGASFSDSAEVSREALQLPTDGQVYSEADLGAMQLLTFFRVGIPATVGGIAAFLLFPALALFLASVMNDAGVFAVLSQDSSQFVQNFLTVSGLLFSILVGQTYYFMYQQQESIYYALFNEVTEAKSLLEQVALVCQGRSMYGQLLDSIAQYVRDDLKMLSSDPAILLSARPVDDPLESIMYLTSVGVPSVVYDTVRSLRQARSARLGSLQRKLPQVHMLLLWILGAIELVSFPLLGAGTQTIGGYNILTVEGGLFGVMTFGIVLTLRVVTELWRPAGGAYNVDAVLSVMVKGLEEELQERLAGGRRYVAEDRSPSLQYNQEGAAPLMEEDEEPESSMSSSGLSMMTSSSSSSSSATTSTSSGSTTNTVAATSPSTRSSLWRSLGRSLLRKRRKRAL